MLAILIMLLAAPLRAKHFRLGYRQRMCVCRLSEIAGVLALCGCAAGMTGDFSTGTGGVTEAIPEQTLRFAPRIALVIGNGSYRTWSPLDLSHNDATAMAKTLKASGFTLIENGPQLDVGAERFHQLIDETTASIRVHPGAIVLVYFSGHGFAPQGHNKLVPVDAPLSSHLGASLSSIDVNDTAQSLSAAGSGMTILLLDACRGASDDAVEFVDVPVPPRTFIGFGTYFGTSSFQGAGSNSRYTTALLEAMKSRWDRLGDLHQVAASRVGLDTRWEQIPVYRAAPGVAEARARIAFRNPESAFARLNLNEAAGGADHDQALLAARCASFGTMSLLTKFMDLPHFGLSQSGPMTLEIPHSAVSTPEVLTACRSAYVAGARDPATIRGYSMAIIADVLAASPQSTDSPSSLEERTGVVALLVQAADSGDGIAETFLALAQAQVTPSKVISIPFDRKLAGVRLLHAAEFDEVSPFSWMVGLSLIKPGTGFRDNADFDFPRDPHRGFQIILRAAQRYDPMALIILYLISEKPQIYGYSEPFDFRNLIRAALDQPSPGDVGPTLVFNGLTVRQTLYALAILDTWGSAADFPASVQLAAGAEPWFPKFLALINNQTTASVVPGNIGCALLGGIKSSHPVESVPHDAAMGVRFLQMATDMGNNLTRLELNDMRQGFSIPCNINLDNYGVPPR